MTKRDKELRRMFAGNVRRLAREGNDALWSVNVMAGTTQPAEWRTVRVHAMANEVTAIRAAIRQAPVLTYSPEREG